MCPPSNQYASFCPLDPFEKLVDNLATFGILDPSQPTLYFMSSKHLEKMKNHYLGPSWVISHLPMTCMDFDLLWSPKQGLVKPTWSKHTNTPPWLG